MKKTLLSLIVVLLSLAANAQTNVSGGIYSNTTWTKANSPYIVIDTVVVFPGVTLTIEPGVTVKFDNNQGMEIRQGTLIANGTATDSITFTSSSAAPTPGIYGRIYLNSSLTSQLIYCNFYYATTGLDGEYNSVFLTVRHCKIMHNINGIKGNSGTSGHTLLDSCDVEYNTGQAVYGFNDITNCTISNNFIALSQNGTVNNCNIDYNSGYGLYYPNGNILNSFLRHNAEAICHIRGTINNCVITNNQVGVSSPERNSIIRNCVIDSNTTGISIHYNIGGQGNLRIDSCHIEYNGTGLDDGNNGLSSVGSIITKNIIANNDVGIILTTTKDSIYCNNICNNTTYDLKYMIANPTNSVRNNYWCTTDSASTAAVIHDGYDNVSYGLVSFMPLDSVCSPNVTAVNEIAQENSFRIYPNPLTSFSTIFLSTPLKDAEVIIYDMLGKEMIRKSFSGDKMEIERGNLVSGIYFVKVKAGERWWVEKVMVE